jgi:fatty-acyl-CoA synthase
MKLQCASARVFPELRMPLKPHEHAPAGLYPGAFLQPVDLPMSTPVSPAERPHHKIWPKRLPRALTVPQTSLWFNLEVAAARYPDKSAFVFFGQKLNYAGLKAQAEALAGWLQSQGVVAGDRVALYLQNCPQFVIALYAVFRANAVAVPVNPMNRADEFGHYIADPQTKVVICAADLAGFVAEADAALPPDQRLKAVLVTRYSDAMPEGALDPAEAPNAAIEQWLRADPPLPAGYARWNDALAAGHAPGPHGAGPDDLALLPYTSGTTGLPKGCMHTHRTLMHNAVSGSWSHSGAETVGLGVVPMFHITGMMLCALGSVYAGITHWTCIPTMVIDLFGSPNYKSFDLSSLRYIGGGGAAMPQAVAQRLLDEFGLTFAEGYGLTETAAPSHSNPVERAKLQCLGIPYFSTDARVVDPITFEELPPGQDGEIIIHGPQVFKGYWRHPDATEAAFISFEGKRFFRSGDLGRMDEEGYFFITDRLKRMINASGYKVWPSEVELLLFKCPLVQEACIIAAKDEYRGETVKAMVVLRAEAKATARPEDIVAWAREHMAAYKVPKIVEFVDALPKSGSGKVMWRLLQDQEAGRAKAG